MKHINKKFAKRWTKVDMTSLYVNKSELYTLDMPGRFMWIFSCRCAYFEDPNTAAFIILNYHGNS